MIIETDGISKTFRRHDAVRHVSLSVPQSAVYALVGENGAGKTTTLRMLVNILTPDRGSARVLGVDSRRLARREFLRLGYVSENQTIPDRLTVAQYFRYLRSLYPNWDPRLEAELLARFALPADRPLGKLSHGMRMKAMLAGALSFRPELLILDEPLSGLDPLVRDEVMEGLLHQAEHTTILISSHELSEIEGAATHMAFMDRGRVLFQEPVDEVRSRFREITATVGDESDVAGDLPASWFVAERSRTTFRCVETAFVSDAEVLQKLILHVGAVGNVDVRPMSLREIAKSLMRAMRTARPQ
ncbi:MAG TPA: ABC transporter ATP-binding protein [Vicinamibacterales bacterium]|nr:ABC transporter ATP-binding protein [Vicinamibacterales bacterium]